MCAICAGAGDGPRAELHLPGGVSVWLCAAHGSPEFLTGRGGGDLAEALTNAWRAAGCLTAGRERALALWARRVSGPPPARGRPGSYAWSGLRREAEAAFARGEVPGEVIARLRERVASGGAAPPSPATMRRWFSEARWLGSAATAGPDAGRTAASRAG